MKHKYELRSWDDEGTNMPPVLKINDEPKYAKRKAREYANEHKGIYTLYKIEEVKIYFTEEE